MANDLFRYDLLVQDALRSVVRRVLSEAARNGLPGEHHFNISFKTSAPGVGLPPAMRQKYPDEMTIILQHEFWDLAVDADGFEVSLNFSRKAERLRIPFDAIVGFNDPSVPFGFKLEPRESQSPLAPAAVPPAPSTTTSKKEAPTSAAPKKEQPAAPGAPPLPAPAKPAPASASGPRAKGGEAPKPAEPGEAAKVVSIDAFRKK
ncbi:MAG TPA: ClpXP protease specificity-enhancing factor SspB [Roseiarcus sp.]|nr:ClpXP protease specificity-enhancing factor SspB [Roseiarcus sp.]